MKIIGHTAYGYLAELSPVEIAAITGDSSDNRHSGFASYGNSSVTHPIGTELKPSEIWKHLQRLLGNENERQRIAESLRASATLIEHTPSPITLPAAETPAA